VRKWAKHKKIMYGWSLYLTTQKYFLEEMGRAPKSLGCWEEAVGKRQEGSFFFPAMI